MSITIQDIERHLAANGYSVAATYRGSRVWRRRGGGADAAIGVPSGGERHADDLCLGRLVELGIPYVCDPETPGVYEDRPVAASGRLLASKPIAASNRAAVADRCSECLNRGIGSHGYCPRSDWSADRTRCSGWELDPDVRAPAPERCSLCRAVATVHLPPELGASALCRACADRVRAALEPPAEAERKQMDALYNLGVRGSRVPRCTCPDCCI